MFVRSSGLSAHHVAERMGTACQAAADPLRPARGGLTRSTTVMARVRAPKPAPSPQTPSQPAEASTVPGGHRAHGTTDEVAEHVGAVDPAAGLGAQGVDDGLVGDLHALGADVQDARSRPGGGPSDVRPPASRAKDPASRTAGDHGGDGRPVGVGQLAGQVGGDHPGHPGQAEEADDGVGVVVGRAGQQEGQRGPQHAEGGEGAGAVPGPAAQRPARRPAAGGTSRPGVR